MKRYVVLLLLAIVSACAVLPVSARQEVLVSESFDGRIQRFDASSGAYIGYFIGSGYIAAGADDILYTCSAGSRNVGRIRMSTGERLDDFSVVQSGLSGSKGLAISPDGKLYVSDTYNNRVLRFNTTTGVSETVSLSQAITDPRGIAFGPDGDLYVCGYTQWPQYYVARYNGATGQFIERYLGNSGLPDPTSLAIGPSGDLYALGQCGGTMYRLNRGTNSFEEFLYGDPGWGYMSAAFNQTGTMYMGFAAPGGGQNLLTYNWSSASTEPFTSGGLIDAPLSLTVANVVPEPSSLLALSGALVGLVGMVRRRRR